MSMSREAKDARNRYLRDKYRKDPAYRKRQRERTEAFWERKAQEFEEQESTQKGGVE